jgi:hypothetical protein
MQRNVLGTGAVVLVLGVAGCGGSGSLSRADFVKQANAVCTKARTQAQSNRGNDLFGKILAYEHQTTSGIDGLKPPSELKGNVDQYVKGQNAFIAYVEQFQAAVKAKQSTKPLEKQGAKLQTQQAKLARGLGLTDCHL